MLLAYGELEGERSFDFPVDTLLAHVEIFVGVQDLGEVRILRPDGSPLANGERARIQAFEHMRIATLEPPECGRWRIQVRGRGLYCVTVRGGADTRSIPPTGDLAPILLVDFTFVELGGRPGHEGWFPIEREPGPGEELMARLDLAGSFPSAELGFAGADGRPLDSGFLPLEFEPGGETAHVRCVVPGEPFRAFVRGYDVWGAPFQRMHAPRFAPASER